MSHPKNIQEYVALKVLESLESEKDKKIAYLESRLKNQRICFSSKCGVCNTDIKVNVCNDLRQNHSHCRECYTILCIRCHHYCALCKECTIEVE